MTKGIPTDPIIKGEILESVRNGEMTAYKAAERYNLSYSTVKKWLVNKNSTGGIERNYIAEINSLKKELDNAYRVIGKLTASVERPKG